MNKTPKDKEQMTMIRLSQETREKLKYVGKKGETYDQIISRLFYEHLADDQGQNNTSEYETHRLLRVAKTRTDEQLRELIADSDAIVEEYRGHGGRHEGWVQTYENQTLEQLVSGIVELSLSPGEGWLIDALIDKRLAETELRQRAGKL
jgi:hypothetical protein